MNFKINKILSFIVICLSFQAIAQPGYKGKLNVLSYDFNFAQSIFYPTYNNKRGVNKTHTLSWEKVVSRKRSWEFGLSHYRTALKMGQGDYDAQIYDGITIIETEVDINAVWNEILPLKVYGYTVNIGTKRYFDNGCNIAPMGAYIGYGLSGMMMIEKDSYLDQTIRQVFDVSFNFEWGYQRVYFEKIAVNFGIETRVPFANMYYAADSSPEIVAVSERIVLHNLMNFKIGVGYLL